MKIKCLILASLCLANAGHTTESLDLRKCYYDDIKIENHSKISLDEKSLDKKSIEEVLSQKGYAKLDAKRDRKILLQVPVHHFIIFTYPNSSTNYKNDYLFLTQEVRAESILKLDNMLTGKNTSIDEIDGYMQELMTVYQESVNEVEVDESSLPITGEYFKKVPDCRVNQSKILQEIIDRQQSLINEKNLD